jgi:hypothetical protein
LSHAQIKFLPNNNNSRMCLKREMWTPCPNINHRLHHWSCGRNTTLIRTHLSFVRRQTYSISWILQWKPWERVHSTFQVFSHCPYPLCQKEWWFFTNVCRSSCTKSTHHKKSIPFAPNLRVVGPTQSCQGVHQNWITWSI